LLILFSLVSLAQKRTDFRNELRSLGIRKVEIVNAQVREESGNGTSNLARRYNNYTGMKFPTNRPTTAISKTKDGYAVYRSRRDCFRDYRIWQRRYTKPSWSNKEYLDFLRKVYAKDKNYLKKYKLH